MRDEGEDESNAIGLESSGSIALLSSLIPRPHPCCSSAPIGNGSRSSFTTYASPAARALTNQIAFAQIIRPAAEVLGTLEKAMPRAHSPSRAPATNLVQARARPQNISQAKTANLSSDCAGMRAAAAKAKALSRPRGAVVRAPAFSNGRTCSERARIEL